MRQLRAVSFFFTSKIHIIYVMRVYCFQTAGGLFLWREAALLFSRRKLFLWSPCLCDHSSLSPSGFFSGLRTSPIWSRMPSWVSQVTMV